MRARSRGTVDARPVAQGRSISRSRLAAKERIRLADLAQVGLQIERWLAEGAVVGDVPAAEGEPVSPSS
jgi:hypothetical protein